MALAAVSFCSMRQQQRAPNIQNIEVHSCCSTQTDHNNKQQQRTHFRFFSIAYINHSSARMDLQKTCFDLMAYEKASYRRNKSLKQIYETYKTFHDEIKNRLKSEDVDREKFKLIDKYIGERFLDTQNVQNILDIVLLLSQLNVEFDTGSFTCLETDGTLYFACHTITQRLIEKIETIDKNHIQDIIPLATSFITPSEIFRQVFLSSLYSKYPAIIPYQPVGFQDEQPLESIGRIGIFLAEFFSKSINMIKPEFSIWTVDEAIDIVLYQMEMFKKTILTDTDHSTSFVFLNEFLPIVRPYLVRTARRPEVIQLVNEISYLANRYVSTNLHAQKLVTILHELFEELMNN